MLGWEWNEIDARHAVGKIEEGLESLIAEGFMERQPVRPLARPRRVERWVAKGDGALEMLDPALRLLVPDVSSDPKPPQPPKASQASL